MTREKPIVWMKPEQIETMRDAARSDAFMSVYQERNDAIIAMFADTGIRSKELSLIEVTHVDTDERKLFLPKENQKQFYQGTPSPATLRLKRDTARTIDSYLRHRWKDSKYLFPSRTDPRISRRSLRRFVTKAANVAGVEPYKLDPSKGWIRGEPDDVSTHTFRHSVAYRMLVEEEDNDMYDVMLRLRHNNIQTTINTYSHFEAV